MPLCNDLGAHAFDVVAYIIWNVDFSRHVVGFACIALNDWWLAVARIGEEITYIDEDLTELSLLLRNGDVHVLVAMLADGGHGVSLRVGERHHGGFHDALELGGHDGLRDVVRAQVPVAGAVFPGHSEATEGEDE